MKMLLNGRKVDSSNGQVVEVTNPATGELLDTVPSATREDVDAAVAYAVEAQKIWAKYPGWKRAEILSKAVELAEERKTEIGTVMSRETGKIIAEAIGEASDFCGLFRAYIEKYKHTYGTVFENGMEKGIDGQVVMVIREPLGVVACIVPFNYPILLYCHKIAPALLAGNAVIVKPASSNPLAIGMLTDLFTEAGVPDGVIQFITGSGRDVGGYLCEKSDVRKITFTGSTETGISVYKAGASHLAHVSLELGGNDAFIVCEDANIDLAVEEVIAGRISNSGQICIGSKRMLIQNSVREEFTEKLIERLKKIKQGDPIDPSNDMGCLIDTNAAKEVQRQVDLTVSQGAEIAFGGKHKGAFFEPTILTGVTKDMDVAKDMEIFGPVVPIIGFDTVDEAIEIANQTRYGLGGCVFSENIKTAMKVATEVTTGSMNINGSTLFRSYEMPFGGSKDSGVGREGVFISFDEVTQQKNIILRNILS